MGGNPNDAGGGEEEREDAPTPRRLVRDFLRTVPREPEEAVLIVPRPDGSERDVRRAEVTAALVRLRPRLRRVLEECLEHHRRREDVADELSVSLHTIERDLMEGLDIILARLLST